MKALVKVLPTLPSVEELKVGDNRLTDESLIPLCNVVTELRSLTSLDLSMNKIDDASEIMFNYLEVLVAVVCSRVCVDFSEVRRS